jgi:hypothetical protein
MVRRGGFMTEKMDSLSEGMDSLSKVFAISAAYCSLQTCPNIGCASISYAIESWSEGVDSWSEGVDSWGGFVVIGGGLMVRSICPTAVYWSLQVSQNTGGASIS